MSSLTNIQFFDIRFAEQLTHCMCCIISLQFFRHSVDKEELFVYQFEHMYYNHYYDIKIMM